MQDITSFLAGFGAILAILVIWSIIWKGIALWKAARNNHLGWFIAFLVINTLGILEILYIYFSNRNQTSEPSIPPQPPTQM